MYAKSSHTTYTMLRGIWSSHLTDMVLSQKDDIIEYRSRSVRKKKQTVVIVWKLTKGEESRLTRHLPNEMSKTNLQVR